MTWTSVCRLNEIRPGRARAVLVNGIEIAVCRDSSDPEAGEKVFAVSGRCTYREAPLADGEVANGQLICPLHGCEFDLQSGISPRDPEQKLTVFPAQINGDQIELSVLQTGPGLPDSYLSKWMRRRQVEPSVKYVHALSEKRQLRITHSAHSTMEEFDRLAFVPGGIATPALPPDAEIDTAVIIGSQAQRPLSLKIPVWIAHVSFGAVSIETKVALARGARTAGTALGSGDGGAHGRERDAAASYVVQILPGQRPEPSKLADADALELRISEGGRPGRPAHLSGERVTTEIGLHREILPNVDFYGPQPASSASIIRDVQYLRDAGNGIPVGVKIAAGAVETDLAVAVEAGVDFVTLDAKTASASDKDGADFAAHAGISAAAAIVRARSFISKHNVSVQLVISGGFYRGDHIAKALALGADAVAIGSAALFAVGCQNYQACSSGYCPVGIATQNPTLRLRLNPDLSARRLSNYLHSLTEVIADYCRITGHASVKSLNRTNLVTTDDQLAKALNVINQNCAYPD